MRPRRSSFWLLCVIPWIVAADPAPSTPGNAAPAAAPTVVRKSAPIAVDADQAQMILLSEPAKTVFVANPDIADVQVPTPNGFVVYGKKPGTTTIFAIAESGNTTSYTVRVSRPASEIAAAIHNAVPDAKIRVTGNPNGVTISGSVDSPKDAEKVKLAARQFLGDKETINFDVSVNLATQVTLKVQVAELARTVDKQLGVSWTALGNIGTIGKFPVFPALTLNTNSSTATRDRQREQSAQPGRQLRCADHRARQPGARDHPGGADADGDLRRDREFPRRRRVPDPGAAGQSGHHDRVQELRRQRGLHADGAGRQPHQHQGPPRGQRAHPDGRHHDQRHHGAGAQRAARGDDGGAWQRRELRDRRPVPEQRHQRRSTACRSSGMCRSSARCSARPASSATKASWSSSSRRSSCGRRSSRPILHLPTDGFQFSSDIERILLGRLTPVLPTGGASPNPPATTPHLHGAAGFMLE